MRQKNLLHVLTALRKRTLKSPESVESADRPLSVKGSLAEARRDSRLLENRDQVGRWMPGSSSCSFLADPQEVAWLIKLKFLLLSSCDLGMFRAAGLLISLLLLSQCCSLGARGCSGHPWGTAREVISESPQRVLENMKSRQRFTPRLVCNLVNICRVLYKRLLTTLSACSLDSQGSRRHFEEQRLQDDV
ncbi:hypothetical protein U0070_017639 [Myodes glareolus]|uniref:Uncharacterized protein n=1 Tax=Myodes glareolus TaxID=447135 RepID=A0AAW0K5H1_MYOGA